MRANIVIYMEEADRDLGETVPGVNDVDTSGSAARIYILPVSVEQLCDVRVLNNKR